MVTDIASHHTGTSACSLSLLPIALSLLYGHWHCLLSHWQFCIFADIASHRTGTSVWLLTLPPNSLARLYIHWQCFLSHWHVCVLIHTIAQPTSCLPCIRRSKRYGHSDDGMSDVMSDGKLMENGSWTGVFGMLQRREVDFAYIPVTMSSSRVDAMDFVIPAVEMRYCHVYS